MANIMAVIIAIIGLPLLIEWVYDPCVAAEKRLVAIVLPTLDEERKSAISLWLPLAEANADGHFFVNEIFKEKDKETHPALLRLGCTVLYYRAFFSPDQFKSSVK
jgi:hypothetical protein